MPDFEISRFRVWSIYLTADVDELICDEHVICDVNVGTSVFTLAVCWRVYWSPICSVSLSGDGRH